MAVTPFATNISPLSSRSNGRGQPAAVGGLTDHPSLPWRGGVEYAVLHYFPDEEVAMSATRSAQALVVVSAR